MKGPLFEDLLRSGGVTLAPGESVEDLETMYSLILEARGKTEKNLTPFDEQLALASLCKFAWPGKSPAYQQGMASFKKEFRGIAENYGLQKAFRSSVKTNLSTARRPEQVSLAHPGSVFELSNSPRSARIESEPEEPETA
jgi:hypothetical protein